MVGGLQISPPQGGASDHDPQDQPAGLRASRIKEANSPPTWPATLCHHHYQGAPPPTPPPLPRKTPQPMTWLHARAQSPAGVRHRKQARRDEGSGPRLHSKGAEEPRPGPALPDHESRRARTLPPSPWIPRPGTAGPGMPYVRKHPGPSTRAREERLAEGGAGGPRGWGGRGAGDSRPGGRRTSINPNGSEEKGVKPNVLGNSFSAQLSVKTG